MSTVFQRDLVIKCLNCDIEVYPSQAEIDDDGQVWLISICPECGATWKCKFMVVTLIE